MCQPKVYLKTGGEEKEYLKDIIALKIEDEKIVLKTLLDGEKVVNGRIEEIDFLKGKVVIESYGST
jgi:predicted RNA-binding protein